MATFVYALAAGSVLFAIALITALLSDKPVSRDID